MPKPKRSGHEAKRARFIAEYLIDRNATQAAIRAGYSAKTAGSQGSALLKYPEIAASIAARTAEVNRTLADRYEVTADKIQRELAILGFSNILDYGSVAEDGHFDVDLSTTTRDQFAAVQEITSKVVKYGRAKGAENDDVPLDVERQTRIKLAGKREALVDLGKIHGLFRDGVEVTMPVQFVVEWSPRTKRKAAG